MSPRVHIAPHHRRRPAPRRAIVGGAAVLALLLIAAQVAALALEARSTTGKPVHWDTSGSMPVAKEAGR